MAKKSEKSSKSTGRSTPRRKRDLPVAVNQPVDPPQGSEDHFKQNVVNRLVEILDQASVPTHGRVSFLAGLTGRNRQTVTAWLKGKNLPDLQSFAVLAMTFDFDMYYILGISPVARRQLPISWTLGRASASESVDRGPGSRWAGSGSGFGTYDSPLHSLMLRPMVGDAMAPEIKHNEIIGIDTSAASVSGDGIYALVKEGVLFVRRIEVHFDGGYTLHSRNDHYDAVKISSLNDPALEGMKVLGRVQCVVKPMS